MKFISITNRFRISLIAFLLIVSCPALAEKNINLETLGNAFFFDVNLSKHRNQSCATCHAPAIAFTDPRLERVSLGSDNISKGNRNSPSISYSALIPTFHKNEAEVHTGGFFYDGRATSAEEQITSTLLNPKEMAMQNVEDVVMRLKENTLFLNYVAQHVSAPDSDDTETLFNLLLNALVEFQNGNQFMKFNSKYDRSLIGEYTLNALEERGRNLFFSDVTNCMNCHHLSSHARDENQIFSDHLYHNIGVPSASAMDKPDEGLANNLKVSRKNGIGKFRTPSLRNVAVTSPYMHNGVFKKLETAVHFYNKHIVNRESAKINPETEIPYGAPDIEENIALNLLQKGQPLSKDKIAALLAFLKTLTDKEYEHLLSAQ